jgi:hypothetical protein
VNAGVRHLAQPALDRQVRSLPIDDQAFLGQSAGKRNPEALPQITDEPLHLALGLRPIRRTQPQPETAMPGKVEKARMEAVSTATIAVPLHDNRPHVVVQHLVRHPAKGEKRVIVRLDQRLDPLVGDELDIGGAAPTQGRHKHRKPVAASPNDRPVDLHLLARPGLKTDDGSSSFLWLERGH